MSNKFIPIDRDTPLVIPVQEWLTEDHLARFICQATTCQGQTFILDYFDQGRLPEIKQKIIDMALESR